MDLLNNIIDDIKEGAEMSTLNYKLIDLIKLVIKNS